MPQFSTSNERRNFEDYILQEYFKPYFLSGVKRYIERGDCFQIEDLEMFVLNSFPINGFISTDTNVLFKFGLNKEKCLEKIHHADNKYAFSLMNLEENNVLGIEENNSNILNDYRNARFIDYEDNIRLRYYGQRLSCIYIFII